MVDTRPGPGPERAGALKDTHPPGRRERAIAQPPARPADAQAAAGTMAEKVTGRSSHPSTNWFTRTYTFLPTGGTP